MSPAAPAKGCACAARAQAKRIAKLVSERARQAGAVPVETVETAGEWFARFVKLHGELGNGTAQHLGDWTRYVPETLRLRGSRPGRRTT